MSRRIGVGLVLALGLLLSRNAPASAQEAAAVTGQNLDIPIFAEEPDGIARIGEMVRSGVPLPESAGVTDAAGLYLLRRDERGEWKVEVPLQARVTSRWGGTVEQADRPARWVLVDFPASVARGGGEEYRLRYDADGARGTWRRNLPAGQGLVSDLGDRFAVNTGAVQFDVRKDRFGVYENLKVLVKRDDGTEVWEDFTGPNCFDVNLVDSEGVEYRPSLVEPQEVIPEELGPLVSVLRIRGQFANRDGQTLKNGWIGYTIRLHVYAGSAFTRAYFSLENNGLYGLEADWSVKDNRPKWLYFDSLSLDLTGRYTGETAIRTGPVSEGVGRDGAGSFRLFQGHEVKRIPEDLDKEKNNFYYDVRVGDREVFRGDRSPGVVKVSDGLHSISAGVRHFWQNYPKAVSFKDGRLSVELWPAEGYWPDNDSGRKVQTYQFEGGRQKTYEVGYDFTPHASSDPVVMFNRLGSPLFGRASPEWYARTLSIDYISPGTFEIQNAAVATALRRFNQMHEAYVDVTKAEPQPKVGGEFVVPPISIVTQREMRGNAYKMKGIEEYWKKLTPELAIEYLRGGGLYNLDMYGWMNFGDLPYVWGWCSLHHDWPYGMFLQYLRHGGKREFFDIGEEMVRHRYDIDQYHNKENKHENWWFFNGFQRFDRGWHGDYDRYEAYRSEGSPLPGFTWLNGLLLHHALTGDPRSLEAARENAEAFYQYYRIAVRAPDLRSPIRHRINLRDAAMAIEGLVEFYQFTAEAKYLRMAEDVYANHVRYTEELVGNNGFFFNEARQELENLVMILEPLRKLHMVNGDPEVLALMARILYRLKAVYLQVSGFTELGRYMPLQLPIVWVAGQPDGSENWYGWFVADAFAYVFLQTGEKEYMDFARWLFHDSVIYFQAGPYKLVMPEFESEISYNPRKYPHTESLVNATVLRGHQVYLYAEWSISGSGGERFSIPTEQFLRRGVVERVAGERGNLAPADPAGDQRDRRDYDPPVVTVKDIQSMGTSAVLSIFTNEKANVRVEYGTDETNTVTTPVPFRSDVVHEIRLTGLEPNRNYIYRIHAIDLAQNKTITEYRPLRSVKDTTPPAIVRVTTPQEDRVIVEFSEPVVLADGANKANFRIEGVTISEASTDASGRRTTLITSPLAMNTAYLLSVAGIRDLASPANGIAGSGVGAPRRFYREFVGDDSGPTFRVLSGDWGQTTTDLESWGGQVRFANVKQPGIARAEWQIPIPEDGQYEVYAWWPKSPLSREVASIAQYRVRYLGGLYTTTLNQRYRPAEWVLLGTFRFRAADGATIQLSTDGSDGTVLADAVRVVYTVNP